MSEATTLDLSYEYVDHERFIDRGIPQLMVSLMKLFKRCCFWYISCQLSTVEADIFRATMTTNYSETSKGIFTVTSSEFEKMYQNLYAQDMI